MSSAELYLDQLWSRNFRLPDTREIWQWFHDEAELPRGVYAVPGKFDIHSAPQLKGPLAALRNPSTREVTSMAAVQCLKTLAGEMYLCWVPCNNPGPSQWLQNTDEEGDAHAKERFIPLMECIPALQEHYRPGRHEKTNNFIRFKSGWLRIEGVYSGKGKPSRSLQRKSIMHQVRSEVWQRKYWTSGKLREAMGRQTQFIHNSKGYTESQPGWIDRDPDTGEIIGDDLYLHYLSGTQNIWHFHCLECKRPQPWLWNHQREDKTFAAMRWEDSPRTRRANGSWKWAELAQTIRYECIFCGHPHHDDPTTRRRLTENSHFHPANPDAGPTHESFTWNQLGMPTLSWFETKIGGVKNYLLAKDQADKGNWAPLEEFFQKVMAEPSDPAKRRLHPLLPVLEITQVKRDERDVITFQGTRFEHIFAGFDVQEDHMWFLIAAFSKDGKFILLDFGKTYSFDALRTKQQQWKVPDQNVVIDCRHRQSEVFYWATVYGHPERRADGKTYWMCWVAMRGDVAKNFEHRITKGPRRGTRLFLPYTWPPGRGDPCIGLEAQDERRAIVRGKSCKVHRWSNPTIKDIAKRLRDAIPKKTGRGYLMPGDWNDELSKHLHSERKYKKTDDAEPKWRVLGKQPNHGWDCFCMIITRAAMFRLLGSPTDDSNDETPLEPPEEGG